METNEKKPFYKQKKFWATTLTISAGAVGGAVTWWDAIAQILAAAFGG